MFGNGGYESETERLIHSRVPSISRPSVAHLDASQDELSVWRLQHHDDVAGVRRKQLPLRETEGSNQLTLPSTLTLQMKHASLQIHRQDAEDDDSESVSDSDSGSYRQQGSYGVLDGDPILPAYPSPPVHDITDEALTSFPLPPTILPTPAFSPPQMIVSPASPPSSPQHTAEDEFHMDERADDDLDDTRPVSWDEHSRL